MRQSNGVLGADRVERVAARSGARRLRVSRPCAAKEKEAVGANGLAAVYRWVLRPLKVPAPQALRVATCVCQCARFAASVGRRFRLIERPDLCLGPPGGYCRSLWSSADLPEVRLVILSGVGPLRRPATVCSIVQKTC